MNKQLSESELNMVYQLAEEMEQEANEALTLKDNMEISLAGRIDTVDEQLEVREICRGIHEFEELYKELEEENSREKIRKLLDQPEFSDKSISDQYGLLAESMEAFLGDMKEKGYDIGEFGNLKIKKDKEISEEDLRVLKDFVAEYLDQFALLHGEAEAAERLFQAVGAQVSEELLEAFENSDKKYYIALAVYILQIQGKIDYIPAKMGARGIGISVSASSAAAKTHMDGILSRISWKKVLNKLKKIASAALTLLLGLAAAVTVYEVGKTVLFLSAGFFGYGVLGITAAIVLMVVSQIKAGEFLTGFWSSIREAAEEKSEAVRDWITETAIPALKEFWETLKEKITCFIEEHFAEDIEDWEAEDYEIDDTETEENFAGA